MARPQEFDDNEASKIIVRCFREHGYANVSIKLLEEKTGLSSGSLYNRFGGKHAIFVHALKHYIEHVVQKRIDQYLVNEHGQKALTAYFLSVLDEPDDAHLGCLLTNTSIEFSGAKGSISEIVRDGFDRMKIGFENSLGKTSHSNQNHAAFRLLTYYQGVLVLLRNEYDKTTLGMTIPQEIQSIIGE